MIELVDLCHRLVDIDPTQAEEGAAQVPDDHAVELAQAPTHDVARDTVQAEIDPGAACGRVQDIGERAARSPGAGLADHPDREGAVASHPPATRRCRSRGCGRGRELG